MSFINAEAASGSAIICVCTPGMASAGTRFGSRKNIAARVSRTSRLADIIAVASRQASLMLNFMPIPSPRMRPDLDNPESSDQQIAAMDNSEAVLGAAIEWRRSAAPVPYRAALAEQQARNDAIAAGEAA